MTKRCEKCNTLNSKDAKHCKNCGYLLETTEEVTSSQRKAEDSSSAFSLPFLGPRFKILELLGVGGMGRVYKVKDTELDEIIAVKLLLDDLSSDAKIVEYFKREIKLARKVKHKNIARVYDLQQFEGKSFITMEFVDGTTLKNLITKRGSFSLKEGIQIIKQICEGLKACHDAGIIHRDISSKNIMIDRNGNALIMDFGIARSVVTGATATVVGTPHYMSPEQLEGKMVDARSDIYSLGVVMFEMFTGSLPFTGTTPISIAMKHLKEKPVNPARLNRALPKKMCEIILKCLEKEKTKRYQNIEELLKDILEVEELISTEIVPLPKRKFKINYLISTTLIITFLMIGSVLFFLRQKEKLQKPVFEQETKDIETQPSKNKISAATEIFKSQRSETSQNVQKISKTQAGDATKEKQAEKLPQTKTPTIPQKTPKSHSLFEKPMSENENKTLIQMGYGKFAPVIPFDGTFILVDGEPIGISPVASLELKEGKHKIELKNHELNAYLEDEIEIIAGETITKNYSFPQKGIIQVSAIPWAEIFIEGKSYGQTPIDRIELPVGYYELIFRHPAFPEKKLKVIVRGEEITKVETVDMRK